MFAAAANGDYARYALLFVVWRLVVCGRDGMDAVGTAGDTVQPPPFSTVALQVKEACHTKVKCLVVVVVAAGTLRLQS